MSLAKDDRISKADLKRVLSLMILTVGLIKLVWFGFLMLFIYMGERLTIPDTGLSMTLLILGIVETLFSWIFLKWEEWQTPRI